MADEATPATTTETTTAPPATEATQAPQGEAKEDAKPSKPLTVAERLEAALAKTEKPSDKPADKAEAKEGEAKPKDEPAKEPEKVEPRLSRGMAILAEREAKVLAREKAWKESEAQHRSQMALEAADLDLVRKAREALSKGGKAAALKVLGIDLKSGIEELSRTYEEPTAEDIARRVAAEEWENRQKAQAETAAKAQAEKAEQESAADRVRATEFCDRASQICGGIEDTKYPRVIINKINGEQFWQATKLVEASLGRRVTPEEVLGELEKELRSREEAAKNWEAKRSAPTAAAPAKPTEAPKPQPAKQENRRASARPDPLRRAEAALKRLNIS